MTKKTAVQIGIYVLFCAALFAVPLFLSDAFLLNKISRYLVFSILAMSLSLSWGYAGILNLGQAVSFGLGSYCLAMALKLRTDAVQTGGELPDFMTWNNVEALPWFWVPFHSITFALIAGIAIPVLLAAALGWFMFRGRITGVFVAIITLAMLVVVNLVIVDQQAYTGGFNGITDLTQLQIAGFSFDAYGSNTYYLVVVCLTLSLFVAFAVVNSKSGLIMQAARDDSRRVRYFGYDVAHYQILAFCISAGIAGLAGMLYTVVMEFASPTFLGIPLSLSVVIWCAVGGRQSLLGALIGALVVTGIQGVLSESEAFLNIWLLIMGALFVAIVLLLPKGLVGLVDLFRPRPDRTGPARPAQPTLPSAQGTAREVRP